MYNLCMPYSTDLTPMQQGCPILLYCVVYIGKSGLIDVHPSTKKPNIIDSRENATHLYSLFYIFI